MRRFHLMKRVLVQMGIEPGRLKLLWASAAEGAMFAREINKFVEEVRELGPLNWTSNNGSKIADHVLLSVVNGQPSEEEEVKA
jgi:hypothetical protein